MSFQPTIPLSGPAGWRFLQRTQVAQQAAFEKSPEVARDLAYFAEKIGTITSAADLVADRRLLKVALTAFGLEGEIDKKAFVRKVLAEGSEDPRSFTNRLAAPGYRAMAQAFGFGDAAGPRTDDKGFATRIAAAYKTRAFEGAVGAGNGDMRLAMNFRREIAALAQGAEGGSWYSVIGSSPLRQVVEKAFNLPREFGRIDVDRQREVLREKTSAMFGTPNLTAFADPVNVERMIDRFLARAQLESGGAASDPASGALTLLRNAAQGGSQGLFNLLAARS